MPSSRSELHREVVDALVTSKAINFEAVGATLSKYGARAAVTGDAFGVIISRRVVDICIPPDPYVVLQNGAEAHAAQGNG
jgi:hypothetical protein